MTAENQTIGEYCSAMLGKELYPAIYIQRISKFHHQVYFRHIDQVLMTYEVSDLEIADIREKTTPTKYSLMESPSYFRLGTELFIKWGNNSYSTNSGIRTIIDDDTVVDKITATISL